MTRTSALAENYANSCSPKTGPRLTQNGATNLAIILKIRELYEQQTIPVLANWLKLTLKTAKNRLSGRCEFSLDEVSDLLHSDHGFEILSALMERAPKKPEWWKVCEPLMQLADAERMVEIARRRTQNVIRKREESIDALETGIRLTQAAAIHHTNQARHRTEAVGQDARLVAARQRLKPRRS